MFSAAGAPAPDHAAIESVILHVLAEKGLLLDKPTPAPTVQPARIPPEQEQEVRRQAEKLIGEKGLSAMQHTMAAFPDGRSLRLV